MLDECIADVQSVVVHRPDEGVDIGLPDGVRAVICETVSARMASRACEFPFEILVGYTRALLFNEEGEGVDAAVGRALTGKTWRGLKRVHFQLMFFWPMGK